MWTGKTFGGRHNHGLTPAHATHAATVANAILKRAGDEGLAIATANAREDARMHAAHRASGGMLPISQATGLHAPALHLAAPHSSGIHLAHISMPHIHMPKRDVGGPISMPTPGLQPSVNTQNPMEAGYLQQLMRMSPEQLQEMSVRLGGSPYGRLVQRVLAQKQMAPQQQQATQNVAANQQTMQAGVQQALTAEAPSPLPQPQQQARGGASGMRPKGHVPILAAGGEFVVSRHHVARLGGGDVEKGHRILDRWVVEARKKIIDKMSTLKPPVKS